jgi:3',5'-cyclic-AMP phosphodiesterase
VRVTWLTDLHLNFLDRDAVATFLAKIAAEEPDVLLVTGDIAESPDVFQYVEQLSRIARMYFVLGNHDFYESSIEAVRKRARKTESWLPSLGPVRLGRSTALVGVDGWGDARCGNLRSRVQLSDWRWIDELKGLASATPEKRAATLNEFGDREAGALRAQLTHLAAVPELIVLTHVPPFPEACCYDGHQSEPDWLPWFTCVAVGDVLREFAAEVPACRITVLCGHSHGRNEYQAAANLVVRTGGWPPGVRDYGNPLIQGTWQVD